MEQFLELDPEKIETEKKKEFRIHQKLTSETRRRKWKGFNSLVQQPNVF